MTSSDDQQSAGRQTTIFLLIKQHSNKFYHLPERLNNRAACTLTSMSYKRSQLWEDCNEFSKITLIHSYLNAKF